jgi:hypothetical protein
VSRDRYVFWRTNGFQNYLTAYCLWYLIVNLLLASKKVLTILKLPTVPPSDDLKLQFWPVLWNRNYFFRFRFRLLKSYSSGSDFWKSYGSGFGSYFRKVPVPVPTPYLDHKKQIKNFFLPFFIVSCFSRKKFKNFNKFIVKCEWKKILNEGNPIHNFISSSSSGTVINYGSGSHFLTNYGSGSTSQRVTVPTVAVAVPQQWFWPQNPPMFIKYHTLFKISEGFHRSKQNLYPYYSLRLGLLKILITSGSWT